MKRITVSTFLVLCLVSLCLHFEFIEESMLMRARNFGDRDMHRKAQAITTPSCETLQKMQNQ